jgi:hypothetical protein
VLAQAIVRDFQKNPTFLKELAEVRAEIQQARSLAHN